MTRHCIALRNSPVTSMTHGASAVSLHMTPVAFIVLTQQCSFSKPSSSANSSQPSPPHVPHPSTQHTLPVPPEERTPAKSTPHSPTVVGTEKKIRKIHDTVSGSSFWSNQHDFILTLKQRGLRTPTTPLHVEQRVTRLELLQSATKTSLQDSPLDLGE